MKINVATVKKEIGSRQPFIFQCEATELFPEESLTWTSGRISVEGSIVNNGRLLEIEGVVCANAVLNCDRCLEEFKTDFTIPFHDFFKEQGEADDSQEGDFLTFQGEEIDIAELIRETLILAEPLQKLCSETCKGLCSHCGVNLNTSSCGCVRQTIDPRLAALKKLLEKE